MSEENERLDQVIAQEREMRIQSEINYRCEVDRTKALDAHLAQARETLRVARDRIRNGPHGIQAWQGKMLNEIDATLRVLEES